MHGFAARDLGAKLAGTLSHMLAGWLVASIVGVALGALIGSSRRRAIHRADSGIPASAAGLRGHPGRDRDLRPDAGMALGVIAFGSIWPMLLATIHGFAHRAAADRSRARSWIFALAGRSEDRPALRRAGYFVGPAAGPDGVADFGRGLRDDRRARRARAWVLLAARAYQSADIFAGVILLGAIGVVANGTLSAIESRLYSGGVRQNSTS